jgi:hypothetical protein
VAPALAALPQPARLYGIPVVLDEVTAWRNSLPQDRRTTLPGSPRYYTDLFQAPAAGSPGGRLGGWLAAAAKAG